MTAKSISKSSNGIARTNSKIISSSCKLFPNRNIFEKTGFIIERFENCFHERNITFPKSWSVRGHYIIDEIGRKRALITNDFIMLLPRFYIRPHYMHDIKFNVINRATGHIDSYLTSLKNLEGLGIENDVYNEKLSEILHLLPGFEKINDDYAILSESNGYRLTIYVKDCQTGKVIYNVGSCLEINNKDCYNVFDAKYEDAKRFIRRIKPDWIDCNKNINKHYIVYGVQCNYSMKLVAFDRARNDKIICESISLKKSLQNIEKSYINNYDSSTYRSMYNELAKTIERKYPLWQKPTEYWT